MLEATNSQLSALETYLQDQSSENSKHSDHLSLLALQVMHNLQYQHRWTGLEIHTKAPISGVPFPRPIISGLPPNRLYVHPDEQAQILKDELERRDQRSDLRSEAGDEVSALEAPQKEWVLPSHTREKWSLKRFAEVFDAMDAKPVDHHKAWDVCKRLVLATVQDDSTVVYYFMSDGIVKPRQN
ncbi:uncharacterized protein PV09_07364 [Verruconis gallopava]|uniref:tRNA-splicing endonuclease subunit Sen15 domain-containing protein n=1 Tax=Verruconis gallopava TaxID=253628 RepID=A0A0D2A2U9_9PEZI|nr:uncharacterized protein PV09_07364 [Verruconis gallopava]KIW01073.1 hypothetical protein PV09_07364 [Verruconis gallopava]